MNSNVTNKAKEKGLFAFIRGDSRANFLDFYNRQIRLMVKKLTLSRAETIRNDH